MKKFRTIAGQRLHTTYPEPHTTHWRITRGFISQGFFVQSRSNFLEPTHAHSTGIESLTSATCATSTSA
ncbi:hypothetical protein CCANI_12695 [Corynebacterium canis]|nr:hypothetical protein CCANI_12695 [Corynebacterium canis]